jgi:hypothetical protein
VIIDYGTMSPDKQAEIEQIMGETGDLQTAIMIYNGRHGIKSGQQSEGSIVSAIPGQSTDSTAVPSDQPGILDGVLSGARKLIGRKIPSMRDKNAPDGQKQEQIKQSIAGTSDAVNRFLTPVFLVPALLAILLTAIALGELSIKSALHDTIAG